MFIFLVVLAVIVSILLVLLCLFQNSKKDNSRGNVIGGSGFDQVIGVKKTSDILEKTTLILLFVLFLLCVLSYKKIRKISTFSSPNLELAKEKLKKEKKNKKIQEDIKETAKLVEDNKK